MLRHGAAIQAIGRPRGEHVLQRPAAGQALRPAGGVKEGDVAFELGARQLLRREPTCTRPARRRARDLRVEDDDADPPAAPGPFRECLRSGGRYRR